jgi:hypothetical protein
LSERHDAPNGSVVPVLLLLDEMERELDAERGQLALLLEAATKHSGAGRPLPNATATEALAQIDRNIGTLAARQRAALRLVDGALERAQAISDVVEGDHWAPPWTPPETPVTPIGAAGPDQALIIKGLHRRQLAQVLTVLGALLILAALLVVAL